MLSSRRNTPPPPEKTGRGRTGMSNKSIIDVKRKAANLGIVDDERKSTLEIDDNVLFALRNAVHEERAKEKSEKSQNLLAKIVLAVLAALMLSVAATTGAIYYVVQQSKEVIVLPNGRLSMAHPAADSSNIDVAAMDDRPGAEAIGRKGAVFTAKPEVLFSPNDPPNYYDANDGYWYISKNQDGNLFEDEDGGTRHRRRLDESSVCGNSTAMMEHAPGTLPANHLRSCSESDGTCSLCGTCILGEGFANIEVEGYTLYTFGNMQKTYQVEDALANGYVTGQFDLGYMDTTFFLLYCTGGSCYELTDICSSWFCQQTGHSTLCGGTGRKVRLLDGIE